MQPVEFIAERLVRFSDCDPAGIVFFPNYFRMLNGVVEDWWAHLGKPWTELVSKRRVGTPTVQLDTSFVLPSNFGDTIRFHLSVERLGTSSLVLQHVVVGADSARMRARQVLVATSLDNHKAIPWPDDVRQAINRFTERTS
ncbi:thioesterase family protein [Azoarcus sp. L1K30]|uniref:acyl-CoA thioesterase n=1 Tax=Azoarcus sp. L1K30 TaxID=2820277 RepID=UPI0032C23691